jgi:hypothetical protein
MSNVRANNYFDSSGGSNAVLNGVVNAPRSMGFRNRIINGDMRIDQRNNGASVNVNNFPVDRWVWYGAQTGKGTAQQNAGSVTPPAGFTNYLGFTSSSAYSVISTDYFYFQQGVEGYNVADLGWGAAGASSITMSFWVRSSLTGTFGGALRNNVVDRSYPFTYTISAANTWEQKTLVIAGDTSGTWNKTNENGIRVMFSFGAGSAQSGTAGAWAAGNFSSATGATSVVGTNGATFYITGVQLEAGSVASPFERRDYGRELIMCQRYFWRSNTSNATGIGGFYGGFHSTATFSSVAKWPVTMRAAPTITRGGTNDNFYVPGISGTVTAIFVTPNISVDGAWTEFTLASPTAGVGYSAAYNGQLSVSAEL